MIDNTAKIIKHKVGLLNLAEELGNVSKACVVSASGVRSVWVRHKLANIKDRLKVLEAKVAILTESQVIALQRPIC